MLLLKYKPCYIIVLLMIMLMTSCVKDQIPQSDNQKTNKIKIAETKLGNSSLKLTVYSAYDSLFVGYNPLYITITDTVFHTDASNASITIQPVMDMTSMKHSCPVEQPIYSLTDKSYAGAAAFIMATDGMMGWTLNITTTINGNSYSSIIPIVVKATPPGIKLITSIKDQSGMFYYISLVSPQKPQQKVGLNELEVAVYKRPDMMHFPAVDGLNVSFVPTMPSMGHSSANNVNPSGIGNGHYKGVVNFSMTGDWQLDFTLSSPGSAFADHAFLQVLF